MPLHVSSVGLEVPDDFPQKPYDAVHARVNSSPRDAVAKFEYGGAWNAVVYRFVSCARSAETFANSFRTAGPAPAQPERFIQEDALFGFFVNGLSVIESFFYGLYWIGSMIDTTSFPVRTGNDLRDIVVHTTVKQYIARFGTCPLTNAFGRIGYMNFSGKFIDADAYEKWKGGRNYLAHRSAPGRALHLNIGGGPQVEDSWLGLNISLNDQLTTTRRQWLASTLAELTNGAAIFVDSNL